jgi:hypothetical protein
MVQLLTLTAQRLDEVAGMRWSEIAPNLSAWLIPASRAKNGAAHVVHLSEPARAIIRELASRPRLVAKGGKASDLVLTTTGTTSVLGFSWDANTVTHILGVRAFGTLLLCDQVVGRALRRQSYELDADGLFPVEYADILGIPFDFAAKPVVAKPMTPKPTTRVRATKDREALEIAFPRVEGERLRAEFSDASPRADAGGGRALHGADGGHRRERRRAHRGRARRHPPEHDRVRCCEEGHADQEDATLLIAHWLTSGLKDALSSGEVSAAPCPGTAASNDTPLHRQQACRSGQWH